MAPIERASTRFAARFRFRDVSFKYGCRANVLENLNLRIPAGKTVAIVGESGCGKSTLLKLLMGFYAPTEGRMLIDGVDLRDFELASLRSRIGIVAQDPFIFNGTIAENIALGRPEAPLGEVIAAARAAGLDEFIATLPERYETVIGERGANLSGGQRQRLAIARALVCQPEILIFDEATSHLDTATERAIQESLRTALAGKTVILVAHRLSTIREADLIYVLHQGRVAEEGTHRSLSRQRRPLCRAGQRTNRFQRSQPASCRCHIPSSAKSPRHSHRHPIEGRMTMSRIIISRSRPVQPVPPNPAGAAPADCAWGRVSRDLAFGRRCGLGRTNPRRPRRAGRPDACGRSARRRRSWPRSAAKSSPAEQAPWFAKSPSAKGTRLSKARSCCGSIPSGSTMKSRG